VDRRHDCNIFIANRLQRYVRMMCGLWQFGRKMPIILRSLWPPYPGRYGHQFCVKHRCHMALQVWNHNWLWVLSTDGKSYCCWFVYLEHKMAEIFTVLWSYWKVLLFEVFVFLCDYSLRSGLMKFSLFWHVTWRVYDYLETSVPN